MKKIVILGGFLMLQSLWCMSIEALKPRTHIYSIKNNTLIDLYVWIHFGKKNPSQAYEIKSGADQTFESEPCISKIEIRRNARTKVTIDSGVLRGGDTVYTSAEVSLCDSQEFIIEKKLKYELKKGGYLSL